jgi:hypothetical protein
VTINPKGKHVAWQVGYLYWDRVPQSEYMMAKVKETEGRSSYKCAAEWFERYNAIVAEKGARDAYEIYPMVARYYAAFDDLAAGDTVSAKGELESSLKWARKFAQETLGNETYWNLRVDQFAELQKLVGEEENYLRTMRSSTTRQEKIAATWKLLENYVEMQGRFKQLDNDPLIIRMAALLADYVRLGYETADAGDTAIGMACVLKGIGFSRRMGEDLKEQVKYLVMIRLAALDAKALNAKGRVDQAAWRKMTADAALAYENVLPKLSVRLGQIARGRAARLRKLAE